MQIKSTRQLRGTYPAKLYLNDRGARLSKTDIEGCRKVIAEPCYTLDRTDVVPFESPIASILSARLKGINPRPNIDGEVREHCGNGFVSVPVMANDRAELVRGEVSYSPEGTMFIDKVDREIEIAERLGPKVADPVLGYGKYSDIYFREYHVNKYPPSHIDRDVGFLLYGMPVLEDARFDFRRILNRRKIDDEILFFSYSMERMGAILRFIHEMGLIHRYPHFGNFRIDFNDLPNSIRIVDLGTAIETVELSPLQVAGLRYLDLARTLYDIISAKEDDFHHFSLVLFFLAGYEPSYLPTDDRLVRIMAQSKNIIEDILNLCKKKTNRIQLVAKGCPANDLMALIMDLQEL
ncbi:MAG: hypothetical protein HQ564_01065 [Candidatus Saganbacteria bacterium]|nr:hypothetical protein [Candidatus Saganbacteria bacterium]